MQITFLVLAIFAAVFTATAMIWDLRTRRLPNWLTVGAFVLAILFHVATDGLSGLSTALGGFAVGFGVLLVLWLIGGGGGGDVKLMGALGACLGAPLTLIVFFTSVFFALMSIMVMFVWRMIIRASRDGNNDASESGLTNREQLVLSRRLIPYAVPVAMATWSVLIVKLVAMTTA